MTRVGLCLPQLGEQVTRPAVRAFAERAEQLGYSALWVQEHLHHLSQSAASRLVARMERDGLVERVMCADDRRGIFIVLTDAGRQRYREARPTQRAVLAEAMG